MRTVEIEVFPIAKTQVDRTAVRKWLDHLDANEYEIPTEESATDPALLIALAAKRCYLSFEPGINPNVTRVRKDLTDYLDNILKSGHGSVLEHATWTFAIEGVSRVFTGEMNRHRAGVGVSEGSMRYIRFRDIPFWVPLCLKLTAEEAKAAQDNFGSSDALKAANPMAHKKLSTLEVFKAHYQKTENAYAQLEEIWKDELAPEAKFHGKKQITSMMRRIVPMGVATGGVWTLNIRALRHVLALRATAGAEEEIAYVAGKIAKIMLEKELGLFQDFVQDEAGFWTSKYHKV
jgi:thymidylate synthase (FAD)